MVLCVKRTGPLPLGFPGKSRGTIITEPVIQGLREVEVPNCHHRGCKRDEGSTGCRPQEEVKKWSFRTKGGGGACKS